MSYEPLNANSRSEIGKSSNKKLRTTGRTPAVIYGVNFEERSISVDTKELNHILATEHRIVKLTIDGKEEQTALIKVVQYHPVKDQALHIDFLALKEGQSFKTVVPVRVVNELKSPGVRMGGKLQKIIHKINVQSTLEHLPEHIDVDVSKLGNSQSFLVRDLQVSENVKVLNIPNAAIVNITKAKK